LQTVSGSASYLRGKTPSGFNKKGWMQEMRSIGMKMPLLAAMCVVSGFSLQTAEASASMIPAGLKAKLTLVEDGKSLAPIVISKDAPPFTRQAADELAEYIKKISGVKPEVIEGEPTRKMGS
jgi:hypothetical protein